jgi:hypothetical protein
MQGIQERFLKMESDVSCLLRHGKCDFFFVEVVNEGIIGNSKA